MKELLKIFAFIGAVLSAFPLFAADLITIRTINGVNILPKQSIIDGPDGYLKELFHYSNTMKNCFQSDGSVFVPVDDEAMRYALAYIRNYSLPTERMLSSPLVKNDFEFLLPGIKPKKAKTKAKKIWECAAYCDYKRDKAVVFMSTTHVKLTDAWQNLITLCGQRGKNAYLLTQKVHLDSDHLHALSSMNGSCVHRVSD